MMTAYYKKSDILKISKSSSYHRCIPQLISIFNKICEQNSKCPKGEVTKFHSDYVPTFTIADYIYRFCKHGHSSREVFIYTLILMDRYCHLQKTILTYYNLHRLLLTAFVISCKIRDDIFMNNSYYGQIAGIDLKEMNILEIELLTNLEWNIHIDKDEYNCYVSEIYNYGNR